MLVGIYAQLCKQAYVLEFLCMYTLSPFEHVCSWVSV